MVAIRSRGREALGPLFLFLFLFYFFMPATTANGSGLARRAVAV
jgi:hypothetical protein